MSARVKLPEPLDELLRSELEAAIHEAALHRDDELIAKRRIIDKWGQIDVAAELGVLSRIMRKLVCRLWLDEVSRQ